MRVAALLALSPAAAAKLRCGPSACGDPTLLPAVRAAVRDACPCRDAASARACKKCWKPVVRALQKERGKGGLPRACRKEATRALANSYQTTSVVGLSAE